MVRRRYYQDGTPCMHIKFLFLDYLKGLVKFKRILPLQKWWLAKCVHDEIRWKNFYLHGSPLGFERLIKILKLLIRYIFRCLCSDTFGEKGGGGTVSDYHMKLNSLLPVLYIYANAVPNFMKVSANNRLEFFLFIYTAFLCIFLLEIIRNKWKRRDKQWYHFKLHINNTEIRIHTQDH